MSALIRRSRPHRERDDRGRRGLLPRVGVRRRRLARRWDCVREPRVAIPIAARALRRAERARDVLRPGLGRGAFPGPRATIAEAGHEVASHGYDHQLVYTLTPNSFARTSAGQGGDRKRRRRGVVGFRAPSYSVIESSLVGARRADRGGFCATTPASSRSTTIATAFPTAPRHIRTCCDGRRVAYGSPGLDGPARPRQPADRRRRLLPAVSLRVDEVGYRPGQPCRASTGDFLHASVGTRSGPAANAGGGGARACVTIGARPHRVVWRGCFATSASIRSCRCWISRR